METFWFKSKRFPIDPDEDQETNPGAFGKNLAIWLKEHFSTLGYKTEIVPEDWGWCVICSRSPFLLWVGCGNVDTFNSGLAESNPKSENIVWTCFVEAKVPVFKKIFKGINAAPAIEKLNAQLKHLLTSTSHIELVEEP